MFRETHPLLIKKQRQELKYMEVPCTHQLLTDQKLNGKTWNTKKYEFTLYGETEALNLKTRTDAFSPSFELPWKVTRFEAWRQDHENLVLLINS